ncbi:tetratricopeptide repeat protein [Carboxylicivirga marina]|uniref:PD40 domain-containing protein n=1 Tax=Carboxylicivirga marina TaxID=2800988 RepID=A0ABS1HQM2_9BACT|nr:PD40 domain-containing protein [Carboxylicivirga marina]MBK3519946.1 PD40 domain-containing protein [Carboxylicivirga marina]
MNLISQKKKYSTQGISKMKALFIFIFIIASQLVFSQSKDLEKADDFFKGFNYKKAINAYKKLANEGQHTYYCYTQIARAYSKMNNSEKAIEWYKKCADHSDYDTQIYLLLAKELLKDGKNQEASVFFHKYYLQNKLPHQLATSTFIEYYNELYRDSSRYKIIPLTFNTSFDEFGPSLYNQEMVFTSNRPVKGISQHSDVQTGQSFFNLYSVDKTSTEASLFSKELQTKYNDGPICFSKDFKTAYITRNTNFDTKQVNTLDIFVAQSEGDTWSKDIKRLPIRKGTYTVAHAYITNDSKYIYFSSDMPGGFGGMDLYVCELKNGFLSQAKNLGSLINTAGNEIFPFVDTKGTLYFSSDMHPGVGGYDLFFSTLVNGNYTLPFNLGYPVNTQADDFSLVLDPSDRFGFFASNRKGGLGGDDIYALQLIRPLSYCIIEATVHSEIDSTLLPNAFINITDAETGVIMTVKTNKSGKFNCYLKKDKKYTFEVKRKLYSDFKGVLTPEQLQKYDVLKLNIGMKEK